MLLKCPTWLLSQIACIADGRCIACPTVASCVLTKSSLVPPALTAHRVLPGGQPQTPEPRKHRYLISSAHMSVLSFSHTLSHTL